MEFKNGDLVRITGSKTGVNYIGIEGTISARNTNNGNPYWDIEITKETNSYKIGMHTGVYESDLTLINKTMNIKEKFVLALTKEPQKTFRKAGITNGDDLLTTDGQNIFLSWLLHTKHAEEFKKDIVDGLLAEQKKEKE